MLALVLVLVGVGLVQTTAHEERTAVATPQATATTTLETVSRRIIIIPHSAQPKCKRSTAVSEADGPPSTHRQRSKHPPGGLAVVLGAGDQSGLRQQHNAIPM